MLANRIFSPGLKGIVAIAMLVLLTGVSKPASGPAEIKITFAPESKLKLNGDSSLKKYSAATSVLELRATAKPVSNAALKFTPSEVSMRLDVKDLKSGDGTLDKHMYEALKSEKFPAIEMKLDKFEFKDQNSATASGVLTVAGETRPIELKLNISTDGDNIIIRGSKSLRMTDFGIEPPKIMMGAIKTRNEIEIIFDVICTTENK